MAIINSYDGLMDSFKGKSLLPIYKIINDKGTEWETKMSILKKVFPEESSSNFAERIVEEVGAGDYAPTTEGAEYHSTSIQEGYSSSLEHTEWTNSMEITTTMMEDNKTSDIKRKAGVFAASYFRTREQFRAAILSGGLTPSVNFKGKAFDTKCMDGLSLFNTAHKPKIAGATPDQSNRFTNPFSNDVLGELMTQMQNFKDDRGNVIGIAPDTIIIPNYHSLKKVVFAAIGADKDPDVPAANGFNYLFGTWNVICSPLLVGLMQPTEFILMDSQYNKDAAGAVWYNRTNNDVETDIAERTRNFLLFAKARWSAGFHDWKAFAIGGTETGTTLT